MQFFSLKNASEQVIERLFLVMTSCLVIPLYFEEIRQGFVLLFLLLLVWVGFNVKSATGQPSKAEKVWLVIMVLYASVFILSFTVRGGYTDDGSWRIMSPILILILTYWYYLTICFKVQNKLLPFVAITSVVMASLLCLLELLSVESVTGYRFGIVLRDIGATGFLLPLTFVLLSVLWLQYRSHFVLVLVLISFVLSALVGSRTPLVMVIVPIVLLMGYLFVKSHLSVRTKFGIILLGVIAMIVLGWLTKDKMTDTFRDYELMQKGDYFSSLGLRVALWETGVSALMESPLIGVGPSEYKNALKKELQHYDYAPVVKDHVLSTMQIHNQYLMDWLLSGVLGLIGLFLFLLYPMKVFYQKVRLKVNTQALLSLGLGCGILVVMFFGAIFTYTYTTVMYVLAMSALISHFESKKGNES